MRFPLKISTFLILFLRNSATFKPCKSLKLRQWTHSQPSCRAHDSAWCTNFARIQSISAQRCLEGCFRPPFRQQSQKCRTKFRSFRELSHDSSWSQSRGMNVEKMELNRPEEWLLGLCFCQCLMFQTLEPCSVSCQCCVRIDDRWYLIGKHLRWVFCDWPTRSALQSCFPTIALPVFLGLKAPDTLIR